MSEEHQPQASEKEFYLQHFRHRLIAMHLTEPAALAGASDVLAELAANKTMVVVSAQRFPDSRSSVAIAARDLAGTGAGLVELTSALLQEGVAFARVPAASGVAGGLHCACRLALRLGAHKLVVVDGRGGLRGARGVRSFVKAAALAKACRVGEPLSGWRARELAFLCEAVRGGVESINLTTADVLADELFSYEGAGTLVTVGEYSSVEPLRADDFPQALALLRRGEREGFLVPRSAHEQARLLLSGYGVWLEGRRLAGIASLETEAYRRRRLAEVAGLYTITRFQGEGVGVRVVRELAREAAEQGCEALFACTSNERAARFFTRNHFNLVEASRVPAVKWRGRPGPRPSVFWRDL